MNSDEALRFLSFLNGDVSEIERRCGAGFKRSQIRVVSHTQAYARRSRSLLHRASSGQSPRCSSWPGGQVSLRSLAPPLPDKPASLGLSGSPTRTLAG